jgi:hypothetical protein
MLFIEINGAYCENETKCINTLKNPGFLNVEADGIYSNHFAS